MKDELGRPAVAGVYTADEARALPSGWARASMSRPDKTGDVIVFLNPPYQFDFAEGGTPFRDTSVWWGAHGHLPQSGQGMASTNLYADFHAAGPGVRHVTARNIRAVDLAPTIAYLLGFPPPAQSEGRILIELLRPPCQSEEARTCRNERLRRTPEPVSLLPRFPFLIE